MFVSPPSIKKDDEYKNIVWFGDEIKDQILNAALKEYNGVNDQAEEKDLGDLVEAAKNDLPF